MPDTLAPYMTEQLIKLAKRRYKKELSPLEEKILEHVAAGNTCNCKEQAVSSHFYVWLCTDRATQRFVHHKGIELKQAVFNEKIDLESAIIPFPLLLEACTLKGEFNLQYAQVRGLFLDDSTFMDITADHLQVDGPLFLRKATINGAVRLLAADITGNLSCTGATMTAPVSGSSKGDCLLADGIQVQGDVFLRQATVDGAVRLLGADIGGDLDCNGSTMHAPESDNSEGVCLYADRIQVQGGVFLRQAKVDGAVRLLGADITGVLSCIGAHMTAPDSGDSKGVCLHADGIQVQGGVFLRENFSPEGAIQLVRARIAGGLQVHSLRTDHAWSLDLRHATAGYYQDDATSWPTRGNLQLNGFSYDRIDENAPLEVAARKDWLRRMPDDGQHRPQPYEQLAKVLREAGHESTAKKISIERRKAQARTWRWLPIRNLEERVKDAVLFEQARQFRRSGRFNSHVPDDDTAFEKFIWSHLKEKRRETLFDEWNFKRKLISWLSFLVLGYGYQPLRTLLWMIGMVLLGTSLFAWAGSDNVDIMCEFQDATIREAGDTPHQPKMPYAHLATDPYPAFSPFWYSVDTFIPLVDLHQETYWLPDSNVEAKELHFMFHTFEINGTWVRVYLWWHIISGWILTSLFVVGLTGLMRKSE